MPGTKSIPVVDRFKETRPEQIPITVLVLCRVLLQIQPSRQPPESHGQTGIGATVLSVQKNTVSLGFPSKSTVAVQRGLGWRTQIWAESDWNLEVKHDQRGTTKRRLITRCRPSLAARCG